ncbi:MAG: hypothetical protein JNL32_04760 [Candidatus Kapabacteria bacterium]|nr:hypothetical protein [Candidatus Kapabacteria bacterium]
MGKGKVIERFRESIIRAGMKIALGSDATGDVYYRNSAGLLTRLGIGSSGQVLGVSGGLPAWQAPPSSGASYTIVTKSANETLASGTTTLQDDDHLSFAVSANSWYEGMLGLRLKKSAVDASTNGLRLLLLLPSIELFNGTNWSINRGMLYTDTSSNYEASVGISDTSDVGRSGLLAHSSSTWTENANGYPNHNVQIPFFFKTGGTGGTCKLQWSILYGYAANWTILQNSFIKYYKVA